MTKINVQEMIAKLKLNLTLKDVKEIQSEFEILDMIELAGYMYIVCDHIEEGNLEMAKGLLNDILVDIENKRLG